MKPTCLTDMSFVPENDFVELVGENGQFQTSRARKTQTSDDLLSQNQRIRDKATGNAIDAKMGMFGSAEPVLNEIPMSVPSVEMGLNQDDDMMPWLNCPIDESLQHDDCSEFFPGLSGVIEHSSLNNFTSFDRRDGGNNRPARDSHTVFTCNHSSLEQGSAPKVSSADRPSFSQLYSLPSQQNQMSFPYSRSRVSANHGDGVGNVNNQATSGDSIVVPTLLRDFPSIKTLREVSELSTSKSSLIDFSHFSKPAAVVKANLQNVGMRAGFGRSSMERMETKGKGPIASSSNLVEATPLDSFSGSQKETSSDCCPIVMSPNVGAKPLEVKSVKDLVLVELPDAVSQEDDSKNDNGYCQNFGEGETKGQVDVEKTTELVVASSVCSGNSVERASDVPTQNLKKKHWDADESEGPSEDAEEESVAAKKANPTRGGIGSKRRRAAEVHNLSERRRRERINGKMRALQELVPNCNTVDKASMLEEAIEYLKTLQLQVQIMSMGAGLYMPPMMMTPGGPHMYAAHMAQFSPPLGFGTGMGMGMNFGMGTPDMSGGCSGCSMIQIPFMHGHHLPRPSGTGPSTLHGMGTPDMSGGCSGCSMIQIPFMHGHHLPRPSVTGPSTLHGMGGSNLQMFGLSSQGLQMPVPRAPLKPMSGGPPPKATMALNVSGVVGPINNLVIASSPGSKDLIQNMKLPMRQSNATSSPMNQTSSQDSMHLLFGQGSSF